MYYEYTCYIQLLYVPMYALTNKTSLSLSSLSLAAKLAAVFTYFHKSNVKKQEKNLCTLHTYFKVYFNAGKYNFMTKNNFLKY